MSFFCAWYYGGIAVKGELFDIKGLNFDI